MVIRSTSDISQTPESYAFGEQGHGRVCSVGPVWQPESAMIATSMAKEAICPISLSVLEKAVFDRQP
ncbi:MAG: hypothetical protein H0T56_13360 [Pseudaminobacter sp.]|nr:hypothetical protein [Pseudaminobacter sp.]